MASWVWLGLMGLNWTLVGKVQGKVGRGMESNTGAGFRGGRRGMYVLDLIPRRRWSYFWSRGV